MTSQLKVCRACGDSAPPEKFMARGPRCKKCDAERAKRYRHEQRELVHARARARYAENPERFKARTRTYFAANTEAMKRAQAAYEKTPKCRAYRAAMDRARDARARAATPPWIKGADLASFYRAARRMTELSGEPHEVDHIIPLVHPAVCGLNVPWNLRVIDAAWNREKSNQFQPWRGVA
jgi:hypothetical protein